MLERKNRLDSSSRRANYQLACVVGFDGLIGGGIVPSADKTCPCIAAGFRPLFVTLDFEKRFADMENSRIAPKNTALALT
jgi:hypothetical protein